MTPQTNTATLAAIRKARTRLLVRHPFFGHLAMSMRLQVSVEGDAQVTQTMAVDGTSMFYNPAFVDSLTTKELMSVIAHEVLHIAFRHHLRRGNRDPDVWNQAGDYAINGILIRAGVFNLPDGGLYKARYETWMAEKTYAELIKQQPNDNPHDGEADDSEADDSEADDSQASGKAGSTSSKGPQQTHVGEVWDAVNDDGTGLNPAQIANAERDISTRVAEATQAEAAMIGNDSSNAVAGDVLKGQARVPIPWYQILQDYMLDTVACDSTWSRPNRRFIGQNIYLPGKDTAPNGEIVYAIDASGSLASTEELDIIAGHLNDIDTLIRPIKTYVIYCDNTVLNVDEFEQGEEIILRHYDGGGTAFAPPFNWCLAHDVHPSCFIYFTDGYGTVGGYRRLDEEPTYPVVWATTGQAPSFKDNSFGTVFEVE